MASSLPPMLIGLAAFLLVAAPHVVAQGKTPVAPGPTSGPLNITAILEKGGQYTTLLRLLKVTQVGQQVQSQLNNSYDGLTIFAPTDNAFSNLKSGTLNSLDPQEQVSLILYHVLPRFYSLTTFQTTSNPVRTQASGNNGVYVINVTTSSTQVNVSTGVDDAPINDNLYSDFPLAVYSIDKVLLPYDLFGPKAPAPAPAKVPKKPKKAPATASGPASEAETTPSAASLKGRGVGWGFVMGVGLMSIGSLL